MSRRAEEPALASLVARATSLRVPGRRRLLGIAGPPGAGKSSLAEALCVALRPAAALVTMDGFHRSNEELVALGLRDRKGAPETFDGDAFVALLRRLRDGGRVRIPAFDRHADRTVPEAIAIDPGTPLVVVEGNYLLLDEPPWSSIRELLDEAWYLAADRTRVDRLIARHVAHGRSPEDAREWVLRSDEANARRIAPSEARADLVIHGLPRIQADPAADQRSRVTSPDVPGRSGQVVPPRGPDA